MERMGFNLRVGERLTSELKAAVGCLMSDADRVQFGTVTPNATPTRIQAACMRELSVVEPGFNYFSRQKTLKRVVRVQNVFQA